MFVKVQVGCQPLWLLVGAAITPYRCVWTHLSLFRMNDGRYDDDDREPLLVLAGGMRDDDVNGWNCLGTLVCAFQVD